MRLDTSYGIIPLRKREGVWEIFLVQLHQGHWGFPKGHADFVEESPQQAASRELLEETGLVIRNYISEIPLLETYTFIFQKEKIKKTVYYFLAEVYGEICLQSQEIANGQWVLASSAHEVLTFAEGRRVLSNAIEILQK